MQMGILFPRIKWENKGDRDAKSIDGGLGRNMTSISVVVPVYNSARTIAELHRRVMTVLESAVVSFEIIFVEDSGTDNAWEEIRRIAAADPRVRGIRLSRNFGQHNALLCGIRHAGNETIATLDDDLQNPPEEIPKLLAKLDEGFDVVYGTPEQEQHGVWRDLASQITKAVLQNAMGSSTARRVSAFRVFRTRVRDAFAGYRPPSFRLTIAHMGHDPVYLSGCQTRCPHSRQVELHDADADHPCVEHDDWLQYRAVATGQRHRLYVHAARLSALAYVLAVYFIHGGSVPGFAFLASMVAIFSGAQLFALGIIGEYLARMHFRSMDRPPYVVLDQVRSDGPVGPFRPISGDALIPNAMLVEPTVRHDG